LFLQFGAAPCVVRFLLKKIHWGVRLFPAVTYSPPRGGSMNETVEVTKLLELQESLPSRVQAAAQAVRDAELRLAQVLTKRAAGKSTGSSEVGGARMALSKALRDADDLQRVQSVLPAMLESARGEPRVRNVSALNQTSSERLLRVQ